MSFLLISWSVLFIIRWLADFCFDLLKQLLWFLAHHGRSKTEQGISITFSPNITGPVILLSWFWSFSVVEFYQLLFGVELKSKQWNISCWMLYLITALYTNNLSSILNFVYIITQDLDMSYLIQYGGRGFCSSSKLIRKFLVEFWLIDVFKVLNMNIWMGSEIFTIKQENITIVCPYFYKPVKK